MKTIVLNDGWRIPIVGLGLWKVTNEREFSRAFIGAIDAGYRHFDSAQLYGNEQLLGEAWRASGIPRQKLFLTTKVSVMNFGRRRTLKSVRVSLQKLQTDYIDLLLLHFPVTGLRRASWQALEELQATGKVRSIGVSNFTIRHLEELKTYAAITPAVNQVELHLFLQQPELIAYCKREGIAIEAYSPLAHARDMDSPVISKIAAKHQRSYGQIMLRWCIEQGFIVLPKSVNPDRVRENIDVFDFELDGDDRRELAALDRNFRTCWNPSRVP